MEKKAIVIPQYYPCKKYQIIYNRNILLFIWGISMKHLNYYLLSLALISSNALHSMEASKKEADIESIQGLSSEPITKDEVDICETVQPFSSEPITKIPRYVYENCNQVTRYKWNDKFLENLKGRVQKLKPEAVAKKYKNKEEYVKNAEGFDWVYGLDYLEREYVQKNKDLAECLTIDEVKKINGLFGRLVSDIPGEFRKKDIFWNKNAYTYTENLFKTINVEGIMIASMLMKRFGRIPVCLEFDEQNNIKVGSLIKVVDFLEKNFTVKVPGVDNIKQTVDLQEIENWVQETTEKFPDNALKPYPERVINWALWVEKRGHMFPKAELIESQVAQALEKIKDPAMHPIRKAAFIWFEIVRIHISHEANKRTGKAFASVILCQNGYLPPLITAEDEKRYIAVLRDNFDDENGFEKFLKFVVDMIVKTQEKAKLGEL